MPKSPVLLTVLIICIALGGFFLSRPVKESHVHFEICSSSQRVNCVVDGDTIWHEGIKIRISDIDTPEIWNPHCAAEKELAERAKFRLLELLNAGPFQVAQVGNRGQDRFGRKLRVIRRDGRSLGDILVSEGLAHRWGGKRRSWC